MSGVRQVPPEEGGPGWWVPAPVARDGVLNYRAEAVYKRQPHDFYIEPPWAVERLFERVKFFGAIHDPACGSGNIPRVALQHGYEATGSDIAYRGFGRPHVDFLDDRTPRENIISNPPYVLAERFVVHALQQASERVAMLVRLAFLEGQGRRQRLFGPRPPTLTLIFSSRVSMPPGDAQIKAVGGKTAYCWCIWDRGYLGEPRLGWLP